MKAKQLIILFIVFALTIGLTTCEIGVVENIPLQLNGISIVHHHDTAPKTLIYPVGTSIFYEGDGNPLPAGGTSFFFPTMMPDEEYDGRPIYIPVPSMINRMFTGARNAGQVYRNNTSDRTGNDPSARFITAAVPVVPGLSNRAIMILCERVLVLTPNQQAFETIETSIDDPEGFNVQMIINENLITMNFNDRKFRPETEVTRRYKIDWSKGEDPYELAPIVVGGIYFIDFYGLQRWLPCHVQAEFAVGKPAPISGRPTEAPNFAMLSVLATHEPVTASSSIDSPDGITMDNINDQSRNFYATERAKQIADNIIKYQRNSGGWFKNFDMVNLSDLVFLLPGEIPDYDNNNWSTLDNDSTHVQMQFLARVISMGSNDPRYVSSFYRGLAFILRAQYPSGGWPQFAEPYRAGYWSEITFNDDAMASVMNLLEDIYQKEWHMAFVWNEPQILREVLDARNRGIECILRSQWKTTGLPGFAGGELTVWSQQVDILTLQPSQGRAYELPSISSMESVTILDYLMRIPNPGPRVIRAINAAATWYDVNAMRGYTTERIFNQRMLRGSVREVYYTGNPRDMVWNRFYDLEIGKEGMFISRDGLIRWHFYEINELGRQGYQFITNRPRGILERYAQWKRRAPNLSFPLDDGLPEMTWEGMPSWLEIYR
jgi:pectinesterase